MNKELIVDARIIRTVGNVMLPHSRKNYSVVEERTIENHSHSHHMYPFCVCLESCHHAKTKVNIKSRFNITYTWWDGI